MGVFAGIAGIFERCRGCHDVHDPSPSARHVCFRASGDSFCKARTVSLHNDQKDRLAACASCVSDTT